MLPYECVICDGILDYGDFGSDSNYDNKPTCTCFKWKWDIEGQCWETTGKFQFIQKESEKEHLPFSTWFYIKYRYPVESFLCRTVGKHHSCGCVTLLGRKLRYCHQHVTQELLTEELSDK
jgi:hypothetical protein